LSVSECGEHCKSCETAGAGKCDNGECDDRYVSASDGTCTGKSELSDTLLEWKVSVAVETQLCKVSLGHELHASAPQVWFTC